MSWIFSIRRGADKKLIRDQVPTLEQHSVGVFSLLEAHYSRTRRDAGLTPIVPECVERICFEFGVLSGYHVADDARRRVMFIPPVQGRAVDMTGR